jgi:hypothetical protein
MQQTLTVMARIDRAIHEKIRCLKVLVDGRVEPGHDNSSRCDFFTGSDAGRSRLSRSLRLRSNRTIYCEGSFVKTVRSYGL